MVMRNQSGFTLIELLLSLAITGLLLVSITFGRDNLRGGVQFSTGVEEVANILATARSDVNLAPSHSVTGGSNNSQIVFGQSVSLIHSSSTAYTAAASFTPTSTTDTTTGTFDCLLPLGNPPIAGGACDYHQHAIDWGVQPPAGQDYLVTFGLNDKGQIAVYDLGGLSAGAPISSATLRTTPLTITLVNPNYPGHTGTITIDPQGNISKVIN